MRRRRRPHPVPGRYVGKLIDAGGLTTLSGDDWRVADIHVHTCYSHDALPSAENDPLLLYERARSRGFSYVTFNDHDNMDAYDRVGWHREGVVPAVEIAIRDRKNVGHTLHVNVYELSRRQFAELMEIARKKQEIEMFLQYLREHNLPFLYSHPYGFCAGEKPSYRAVEDVARLFPVLEYNMHRVRKKNRCTLVLADRYHKGMAAVTDTHIGDIGRAYTVARGSTFREFFENIARGEAYLVARDLSLKLLKEEINTWIDLLFRSRRQRLDAARTVERRSLARFLNMPVGKKMQKVTPIRKVTGCVLSTLSRSGAPAFVYLTSQDIRARRINRHLSRSQRTLVEPLKPA